MNNFGEETAVLIGQVGPLNGQSWMLQKKLLVGRELTCDIVISDRRVSRRHAQFTLTPEGVLLEDLGSKNGTHYNGNRVETAIFLRNGDIIQIALAQEFVFISVDATTPLSADDLNGEDFPQTSIFNR